MNTAKKDNITELWENLKQPNIYVIEGSDEHDNTNEQKKYIRKI